MSERLGKVLAFVVLACSVSALSQGQSPSFEVASLKPTAPGPLSMSYVRPEAGGRVSALAVSLKSLIETAYRVKEREISGGPAWMNSDRFDIEAKAATNVPWDPDLRLMLKSLLGERFHLKVHIESREIPVYELSTAKNGPKLKVDDSECEQGPEGNCSGYMTQIGRITGKDHVTIAQLADSLSTILDRPVVDKTGLTGRYSNIKLEWAPDDSQFVGWGPNPSLRTISDPNGPTLFTALQEQVGLQLVPKRLPVNFLIVDSAEKPAGQVR